METAQFVNDLKHILWSIKSVGGNSAIYVAPDYELLKKLRSNFFETTHSHNIAITDENWQRTNFFEDVLSTDRFERRIRYCIIKLREFGIFETEYFGYISKALDIALEKNKRKSKPRQRQVMLNFHSLLTEEIAKCFEIWYYPAEIQLYEVATEHQLVYFDYDTQKWRLSSVGHYVLKLSPFEVIIFLCALEIVLGRKGTNNRYLNMQTLEKLLGLQTEGNSRQRHNGRYPISLRWYGIMDTFSEEPTITELGTRILAKVSSSLDVLRDTILLLTESEVSGFHYSESVDLINQIKERTRSSKSIAQDQKNSIDSAVTLFMTGHYLDSLRLFYSNIEAVLNLALEEKGLRSDNFSGMKSKIEKLEKEKILSSKLSTWLEVVTSRNKVLHGNIIEDDAELVKPLFYFIGAFWSRLVEELDFHSEKIAVTKTEG
jgi:hypothetical protein